RQIILSRWSMPCQSWLLEPGLPFFGRKSELRHVASFEHYMVALPGPTRGRRHHLVRLIELSVSNQSEEFSLGSFRPDDPPPSQSGDCHRQAGDEHETCEPLWELHRPAPRQARKTDRPNPEAATQRSPTLRVG